MNVWCGLCGKAASGAMLGVVLLLIFPKDIRVVNVTQETDQQGHVAGVVKPIQSQKKNCWAILGVCPVIPAGESWSAWATHRPLTAEKNKEHVVGHLCRAPFGLIYCTVFTDAGDDAPSQKKPPMC